MTDSNMIDSDDELLVAYLDGELSRVERDTIENRLVADDVLRLRLQSLQRSWDLLDWLPTPLVDEHSVETTMQFVVADLTRSGGSISVKPVVSNLARTSVKNHQLNWSLWSRVLLLIGVPLVIAGIVYSLARWKQNQELRIQAADFPVALDMDAYRLSEKSDLIDDLIAAPRWRSVVGGSITPAVDAVVDPFSPQSLYAGPGGESELPSPAELAGQLREVPAEQRMIALARWDRFDRLDDTSKVKLRESAARLLAGDHAEERLDTLRRYVRMRDQLSDQTVDQIENAAGSQRETAIDAAIGEMISSIGRITRRNLSEDAIERIDFTVIQLVKSRLRRDQVDGDGPSPSQKMLEWFEQRSRKGDDPHVAYRAFALTTFLRDPNWNPRDGRSSNDESPQEKIPPLSHREFETIRSMLPAKDLDTLQQYVTDPWMQSIILRDWATESVKRKIRGESKPLSLSAQYEDMSPADRERLDLASPDDARKILIDGL